MSKLSHLDEAGNAHMVDVGDKAVTRREAVATGHISMSAEAIAAIRNGSAPKGDVIAAARIAGIMAAKRTSELIPLCHPLALDSVTIDFELLTDGVGVKATASLSGKTGIEMEALTAASISLLTIYDMVKSVDKAMVIDAVKLASKTGGKSGDWLAPE